MGDGDRLRRADQQAARVELTGLPRRARGRRNALAKVIRGHDAALAQTFPASARLDAEIDQLTRQEQRHTQEGIQRGEAEERHQRAQRLRTRLPRPATDLARARPIDLAIPDVRVDHHDSAAHRGHQSASQRDDDRGLSM